MHISKNIKILNFKYLKYDTIHSVSHRLTDSSVWSDLLKVKDIYLMGTDICMKNGNLTRFWKDRWLYQQPLCLTEPELFELCERVQSTKWARLVTG